MENDSRGAANEHHETADPPPTNKQRFFVML
jgi:hypothetical protein